MSPCPAPEPGTPPPSMLDCRRASYPDPARRVDSGGRQIWATSRRGPGARGRAGGRSDRSSGAAGAAKLRSGRSSGAAGAAKRPEQRSGQHAGCTAAGGRLAAQHGAVRRSAGAASKHVVGGRRATSRRAVRSTRAAKLQAGGQQASSLVGDSDTRGLGVRFWGSIDFWGRRQYWQPALSPYTHN